MSITKFVDGWIARASGLLTFWPFIPSGLAGIVTGKLASSVGWISQIGPFGWWTAGILGGLATSLIIYLSGLSWEKFSVARANRKWLKAMDHVDPLDSNFNAKRIKLSDFVHPLVNKVKDKSFINCEIVGPANFALLGGTMNGCTLCDCDIAIVKENVPVNNAYRLQNCTIIGGTIARCTIIMNQSAFDQLRHELATANIITYEK